MCIRAHARTHAFVREWVGGRAGRRIVVFEGGRRRSKSKDGDKGKDSKGKGEPEEGKSKRKRDDHNDNDGEGRPEEGNDP